MKIKASQFNLSYFLAGRKHVENIEEAAKVYGGATLIKDTKEQFSNIPGGEYIELGNNNSLTVFVPNTMDVNYAVDNSEYVRNIATMIYSRYGIITKMAAATGTWYSDDLHQVVYDEITMVTVELADITAEDISFFISLGRYIKDTMKQESVSVMVNNSLCLV
jgi:hypothetical protein